MPASGPEVDCTEVVARIFIRTTYRIENPAGWYYRLKIVVQFLPSPGNPPALAETLKVDRELRGAGFPADPAPVCGITRRAGGCVSLDEKSNADLPHPTG
jgi:hypothetical protein